MTSVRRFALARMVAIATIAGCTNAPLVSREYVAQDSSGLEYRMVVAIDPAAQTVEQRRLELLADGPTARRAGVAAIPGDRIIEHHVWGVTGSFHAPVQSTCHVYDRSNWSCANVNLAVRPPLASDGFPTDQLLMRADTLVEIRLGEAPRIYRQRVLLLGHAVTGR